MATEPTPSDGDEEQRRRGRAPARRTRGCRSADSLEQRAEVLERAGRRDERRAISPPLGNIQVRASSRAPIMRERPGAQTGPRSGAGERGGAGDRRDREHALDQPGPVLEDRRSAAPRPAASPPRPPGPGAAARSCRDPRRLVIGSDRRSRPSPPARRSPASRGRPAARARRAWRRARRRRPASRCAAAPRAAASWSRSASSRARRGRLSQVELSISKRDAGGAVAAQRGQQLRLGRG